MSARPPTRVWRALAVASLSTALIASAATPGSANPESTESTRQAAYQAAATEYGVPVEVLLGVSYLQSRWDANTGQPSVSGGYGPMHLTDAQYVAALPPRYEESAEEEEDRRGDDSRPLPIGHLTDTPPPAEAALQTMDAAASLTGLTGAELRTDTTANIRGGAALLAQYQRELGAPVGSTSDLAAWYGAVARYSGADNELAAQVFADDVYSTIGNGQSRTTDDGHRVTLMARDVTPDRNWLNGLGLTRLERPDGLECPVEISCEWLPAPYELRGNGTNLNSYGNHDKAHRPAQQKIEYIVIHDAEGYFAGTTRLAQDKNWVSWHYTLRSVDGHIAQHLKMKDVGWHAGNWFVNAKAIGLEHEGFAAQGTWYTETMYRSSAKLVRYLALRLGIPLDRQHIIGHDNVQGVLTGNVRGMHWDPGPYWDWSHYFDLLKSPFKGVSTAKAGLVTVNPDFATNKPAFTGCTGAVSNPCPLRPSSSVILYSAPRFDAPLANDAGRCPNGPGTMLVSDHCARASAGQTYAVAETRGDWTAIWYLGNKVWFHNGQAGPLWNAGMIIEPKPGLASIPVYGRAYPEASAFPAGVPVQAVQPLAQYTIAAGQRYAVGMVLNSEYYRAVSYDWSAPGDGTVIRGETKYVQIQFGHRIAYVKLDDVVMRPSTR